MNAVETLQAAIDKLEKLKAESTPGPWESRAYEGVRDPKYRLVKVVEPENEYGYDRVESLADYLYRHNADLIVTLHRTIDAQLAILNGELDFAKQFGWPESPFEERLRVLALAEAILGGAS